MHQTSSIAIRDGKILAVGPNIAPDDAKVVFDMREKILSPSLINIHCHPAAGFAGLEFLPTK
jgi:imidazolonepropionase-like amidohydrolase